MDPDTVTPHARFRSEVDDAARWAETHAGHVVEITWQHHRKPKTYHHRGLLAGVRNGCVLISSTDREYGLAGHNQVVCWGRPVAAGTFRGLDKTGEPSTYTDPATGARVRRFTRFAGDLTGKVEWQVTWPDFPDLCDVVPTLAEARRLCELVAHEGIGLRYRALPVALRSAETVAGWLDEAGVLVLGSPSSQQLVIPDRDTEASVELIAAHPGPHASPVAATVAAYLEPQGEGSLHTEVTRALARGPQRLELLGFDIERHRLPLSRRSPPPVVAQTPWELLWELRDGVGEETLGELLAVVNHHESGALSAEAALRRMRTTAGR